MIDILFIAMGVFALVLYMAWVWAEIRAARLGASRDAWRTACMAREACYNDLFAIYLSSRRVGVGDGQSRDKNGRFVKKDV